MNNLFFDINYLSFEQMLIKIIIFLFISGSLLYLIYFGLTKTLYRKDNHRKEINLRLVFLWTLFIYFIFFNLYIYVLFYKNGMDSFHWTVLKFYICILPQLLIYIGIIIYFFIKRFSLKKLISDKSIN